MPYTTNIDEAVYAILRDAAIASCGRLRPAKTALPFIAYEKTGDDHEFDLSGLAGCSTAQYEFTISSGDYGDLGRLAPQLVALMCAFSGDSGDRPILWITTDGREDDNIEQSADGGQTVTYTRTTTFQVLYAE